MFSLSACQGVKHSDPWGGKLQAFHSLFENIWLWDDSFKISVSATALTNQGAAQHCGDEAIPQRKTVNLSSCSDLFLSGSAGVGAIGLGVVVGWPATNQWRELVTGKSVPNYVQYFIHRNKLRSYGSKLVGKTSPKCPEHYPKLGAQLPRNNFCHSGVTESVLGSLSKYIHQLFGVLSPASVHNT